VAIVQYLADRAPATGLAPPHGGIERYRLMKWLTFVSSELHKMFSPWLFHPERLYSQTVLMCGRMAETLGIGTMDRKGFQAWLSVVDSLSEKAEAMEVLAGRPAGEAALAAVELGVGENRRCPRCGTTGAVSNGTGAEAPPLQGLRKDLRCPDRHAVVRPAPQGDVADVRRMLVRWRHGEDLGGAL
jgi:hypothetical protein